MSLEEETATDLLAEASLPAGGAPLEMTSPRLMHSGEAGF